MKSISKLALASIVTGALLSTAGCATHPAPKDVRLGTVDGHHVAYRVLGTKRPALVMISGLGDGMESFKDVAPELAQNATVIVYDRAGYGGSTPAGTPRDVAAIDHELSGVLAQSGVAGPYVLLGHSIGGLMAEYHAAKHPEQVSGLILEESRPADFTYRCETAKAGMCAPPALLMKLMARGAQDEFAARDATMDEVMAAGQATGKPVLILSRPTGEKPKAFDALWTEAQADLAARYAGSHHLTAPPSGHYLHCDQKDWFVASVRAFLAQVKE